MKKLGAELTYHKTQIRQWHRQYLKSIKSVYALKKAKEHYHIYTMNGGKMTYNQIIKEVK